MADVSISDFLSGSIGFDTCGMTSTKIVQNPVNGELGKIVKTKRIYLKVYLNATREAEQNDGGA